jgi:hypothetical protein
MKKIVLIALLFNVMIISCNSKNQRSNNPGDPSNNQNDTSVKGLQKKYLFLAKQTSTYKDAFIKVTKLQIDLDLVDKGNLDSDAVINEYNEVIGETYGYRSHVYEVRKNLKDKIDTAYLWRVQSNVAANLLLQYMAELKSQMK